jgi:hypothetical protein
VPHQEDTPKDSHRSVNEILADLAREYDSERICRLNSELDEALNEEDQQKSAGSRR